MNTYEFYSSIIEALAWPIVTLSILIIYRHRIENLSKSITKLKVSDVELEFESKIKNAREIIEHSEIVQSPNLLTVNKGDPENLELIEKMSEASPRSLILEAWISIEGTLRTGASSIITDSPAAYKNNKYPISQTATKLSKDGIISVADLEALMILKNIRNEAAHDVNFVISKQSAVEFAIMAKKLQDSLKRKFSNVINKRH